MPSFVHQEQTIWGLYRVLGEFRSAAIKKSAFRVSGATAIDMQHKAPLLPLPRIPRLGDKRTRNSDEEDEKRGDQQRE